jgi:hypothetical protein
MPTLEINLSDAVFDTWQSYADDAGLTLESLLMEATTHSVRTDRLGVAQANLKRLLNETRAAELSARKARASSPPSQAAGAGERKNTASASASQQARPGGAQAGAVLSGSGDESLENANVPDEFFETTGNQASLDTLIPRDI